MKPRGTTSPPPAGRCPERRSAELAGQLRRWFRVHARDLPWRCTRDPYAIWVSEIMLQQTQVKTVIPYWRRWMEALPDIASLARAPAGQIHKLWEGLGYYTRVRNMQKAARILARHHQARFPDQFEAVLALPGIGRYTAGAICSIAFNQPMAVLDGNVIRVLTRVFGIAADPSTQAVRNLLWDLAGHLVRAARSDSGTDRAEEARNGSGRECSELNQALMELGALICLPKEPHCPECPLRAACRAFRSGRQTDLPRTRPRTPVTARRFLAFVLQRGARYLVRQRPDQVVNAQLWEFPNLESGETDPARAAEALALSRTTWRHLCVIKHSITRYRITVEVYVGRAVAGQGVGADGRWRTWRQLQALPFTSAHKRILDKLAMPSPETCFTSSLA